MNLLSLQGKLVAVLGFGQEGKATVNYLMKFGIQPTLFDQKPWQKWSMKDQKEIKELGLNFIFGPDCLKELKTFDFAFRSPGLWRLNPDLLAAEKHGVIITSQTKWFFENSLAKIIGVTGTKGKGTTASLIYEVLKKNFQFPISNYQTNSNSKIINLKSEIYLTGNIGKQQPFEIIDNLKPEDFVVYELSSFQLQDLDKSPHVAVILMTTSEHLDVHKNIAEYLEAKSAITKFQTADDFAVINADYKNSLTIGEQGNAKKIYISIKKEVSDGCFVKNDQIVFVGKGLDPSLREQTIIDIKKLQLRGKHNLENVCAAALVGKILEIDNKTITDAIAGFKGLEHRLEFVTKKNGIKFYNDSFSTTPETAIAAIKSFSEPEIVILGGSFKKSDFSQLIKEIIQAKNIKTLILIGEEASTIKQALSKAGDFQGKVLQGATTMKEIFDQIKLIAEAGDVVLLSPACASFDMFSNYADRGLQFKENAYAFKYL